MLLAPCLGLGGGWAESQGPGDQKIGTHHLNYDSNFFFEKSQPHRMRLFLLRGLRGLNGNNVTGQIKNGNI